MRLKVQTTKIVSLFTAYIAAFKGYKLDDVAACYHLPCTLHTPDRVVLLSNEQESLQEFNDIFSQLKQAKTRDIVAKNASYSLVTGSVVLVSVDWTFIDEKSEIFADFCAVYHLILVNNELKIFNVVSHELSNSLSLNIPIELID